MSEETKYYGGTVTVAGRDLITSLLVGQTIEFTRIVVGSGEMPDGVHPMDMTELVNPIAEAVSTVPFIEDGSLHLTVEYRNDLNGGLQESFWLREFGIYAKTDEVEEVLLYYATLGNSPQPVNAYKDNRIDIRRYPVTIEIAMDNDIQVSFNPGAFITAEEAHDLIGAMVESSLTDIVQEDVREGFVIPKDGWQELAESYEGYDYKIEITDENVKENYQPEFTIDLSSYDTAVDAGLAPSCDTEDGKIIFWAVLPPEKDITGTLTLTYKAEVKPDIDIGSRYVLPPATSTELGGVIIEEGSGLSIDETGRLTVDKATDEDVDEEIDDIFNSDSESGGEDDSGEVPEGYEIATNEEVAAKVNGIFGFETVNE